MASVNYEQELQQAESKFRFLAGEKKRRHCPVCGGYDLDDKQTLVMQLTGEGRYRCDNELCRFFICYGRKYVCDNPAPSVRQITSLMPHLRRIRTIWLDWIYADRKDGCGNPPAGTRKR